MRAIVLTSVLLTAGPLVAEPPWDTWQVFPGPNPEPADIVSNWDGGPTLRFGYVICAYDSTWPWSVKEMAIDLDELPPIAEVVCTARPSTGLRALINSQFTMENRFSLESMTLNAPHGDAVGWWVEWNLRPKTFGSTGIPFGYTAAVTAKNQVVYPDFYLFDVYYRTDARDWLCSTLKLQEVVDVEHDPLDRDAASQSATKALTELLQRLNSRDEKPLEMRFLDARQVDIPLPTSNTDPPETRSFWAIDFTSDGQAEAESDTARRFTIWIAPDGRVADLKVLVVGESGEVESLDISSKADPTLRTMP